MNSFQRQALIDLREAGFTARPIGNWVEVDGEPIFTTSGVDTYIAHNEPPTHEES